MPTVELNSPNGSTDLSGYVAHPSSTGPTPGVDTLGVEHDVKSYPKAGHSFLNDGPIGPAPLHPVLTVLKVGPKPAAAAHAWQRIEAFFATHLAS